MQYNTVKEALLSAQIRELSLWSLSPLLIHDGEEIRSHVGNFNISSLQ